MKPIVQREAVAVTMALRVVSGVGATQECAAVRFASGEIMTNTICAIVVAGFCLIAPALADDPTPDSGGGRYTFSKVAEGLLRLDTQTGEVSVCSQRTVGWACQAVPEDRAVLESEIARLRKNNAALKKELLARGLPLPQRRWPSRRSCATATAAPAREQSRCRPHGGARRQGVASLVDAIVRAQKQVLNKS